METEVKNTSREDKDLPSIIKDKMIIYRDRWCRPSEINEQEKTELEKQNKRFKRNHRGEIIISAKLKEKYCSKNENTHIENWVGNSQR